MDGPSKTAFKKFEAALTAKYSSQQDAVNEEVYSTQDDYKELYEFLKDVPEDDSMLDDVEPRTRGQKRYAMLGCFF